MQRRAGYQLDLEFIRGVPQELDQPFMSEGDKSGVPGGDGGLLVGPTSAAQRLTEPPSKDGLPNSIEHKRVVGAAAFEPQRPSARKRRPLSRRVHRPFRARALSVAVHRRAPRTAKNGPRGAQLRQKLDKTLPTLTAQ